jgi:secretion/DNA translocation related TadE-like protein
MTCHGPAGERCEHGSVTVLVLVLVTALSAMAVAGAVVGALLVGHRRAASAVDLAALGAAAALQRPAQLEAAAACVRAQEVGAANGARLTDCAVAGEEVLVSVAVDVPTVLGRTWAVTGRARAGPVR